MHTIHKKEFELDDFSHDHLRPIGLALLYNIISGLNEYRKMYLETKDKDDWWQLIQLLPSSYNQKRTITMNYENAATIIRQRTGHKLDEWKVLIEFLEKLPYLKTIMGE